MHYLNDRPLVSVVVPVFNVEQFLRECVDSILCQDYPNIEIILIDDGSSDDCPQLCDAYSEKYPNIYAFHQTNAGLSSARNAGLEKSNGEFITFVDSDDWIESDMISTAIRSIQELQVDAWVTGFVNRYENGDSKRISKDSPPEVLSRAEALGSYLFNQEIGVCVCGKVWKRSLWEGIRHPEGKLYEDQYTTYRLLLEIRTLAYDPTPRYNYRQRAGSIGHEFVPTRINDLYEGAKEQYENVSELVPSCEQDLAVGSLFWRIVYFNYLIKAGEKNSRLYREARAFGRKHFFDIVNCRHLNRSRKMQLILFVLSWHLYKLAYTRYLSASSHVFD